MGTRGTIRLAFTTAAAVVWIGAGTALAQDTTTGDDPVVPGAEAPAAVPQSDPPEGAGAGERALPIPPKSDRRPSKTAIRLKGLKGGKLTAGKRLTIAGTLNPFVKGEEVTLILTRGKKTIVRKDVKVKPKKKKGSNLGQFSFSKRMIQPGRYGVQAIHRKTPQLGGSKDRSRNFKIRYPDLNQGADGDAVKIYNELLAKLGYVNDEGKSYDSATGRATLAFRKVNNMKRVEKSSSTIFKMLAKGKGGYNVQNPGSGKHVEVDISRQVMVLAKGGKVDEIYHVSTGAPATPTIPGTWRFYRKEPGTNSLGMVYSVYYNRGYATHGYKSVPTYPASHGCTRNPIPNSRHIYNWIDIGDLIHVHR